MALKVAVAVVDGTEFEVAARGHHLISDQPKENGGTDLGMTPPELLLASLGTCVAYYSVEYLRTHNLDAQQLAIQVSAVKDTKPARLTGFKIVIDAPGCQEDKQQKGLLRAATHCLIHNTLLNSPKIEIALKRRERLTGADGPGHLETSAM